MSRYITTAKDKTRQIFRERARSQLKSNRVIGKPSVFDQLSNHHFEERVIFLEEARASR